MLQRNPNDSHASVLPPHTSTEKRAQNTGARSELSSNQWWPEPPNIDYRRSNGHKHRRTKRAGGRHATHAGHSKTCANTYPNPVPVHRCRCRRPPGVRITTPAGTCSRVARTSHRSRSTCNTHHMRCQNRHSRRYRAITALQRSPLRSPLPRHSNHHPRAAPAVVLACGVLP
jgi:hypothetical protein